jgi:hypothetical protein
LKKSKNSHLDCSSYIEGDILQIREQKKKVKKYEKLRFYGKNQEVFLAPCPSALGQFQAHGLHVGALQKIQEK